MEALLPGSASIRQRFDVHVIRHADHRPTRRGDLTITPYEVRHASGAPAYAVRVDGLGASVAYSGDTELTDALLDAADGTDLVLCEGYSPQPVNWHLDLESLGRHRSRIACSQNLLTHLYSPPTSPNGTPPMTDCTSSFHGCELLP